MTSNLPQGGETPISVLVVDDDPVAREILVDLLEDAGCQATAAGSAGEALCLLREKVFRLVVSDLQMPGFGGDKLSKVIDERLDDPPEVIFFSSLEEEEIQRISAEAGRRYHVRKGCPPGEFLRVVRMALLAPSRG
jgi:CheY-like chemotaxis protein